MPKLGDASAVYAGAVPAKAVYLGGAQVWPLGPKLVWVQDFESGSIAGIFNAIGGSPAPSVDPASARAPSGFGLKTGGDPSWGQRVFAPTGLTVMRLWFRFRTQPAYSLEFISLAYGAIRIGVDLAQGRKIGAIHGTAQAFPILSNVVVVPGQWYLIDVRADTRVQPRVFDWRIDGVDQPGGLGDYGPHMTTETYFGHSTGFTGSTEVDFDDIAVSQTYDDYPLGDVPVTRESGPDPVIVRGPVAGPAIDGYVKGEL